MDALEEPPLSLDARLSKSLKNLPREYDFRYTESASKHLIELLFRSLVGDRDDYLQLLFPHGPPTALDTRWSLREAQGALEGAEYTEAARGHPCGHIFKNGEATYRCRTCTADDTCVLCAKCFDSSDHEGHTVYVSVSPGNSGCCDCGDAEAWLKPVHCTIHSEPTTAQSKSAGKAKAGSILPSDLLESIRITISRALDYLCDVWSCSPEQLRLPKTMNSVEDDEFHSRLDSEWYGAELVDQVQEYAIVLWNDEKHTVNDVQDTVARACRQSKRDGLRKAHEVDDVGRSVLLYSKDLESLLRMAKIIEQPKLTVTIRSARDTFREYMCGTITEWIADISGCNVGADKDILRQTICEAMLSPWRVGSQAHHGSIGKEAIDDHEIEDMAEEYLRFFGHARPTRIRRPRPNQPAAQDDDDDSDEDDDDMADQDQDRMDVDGESAGGVDRDITMDLSDELDDALEASEATLAGYPPPPPPPAPVMRHRVPGPGGDADAGPTNEPQIMIPKTPKVKSIRHPRPPRYWLDRPSGYARRMGIPPHEDLWQRVRLDFLILYDLRMWKKLRTDLRDVFISTVVTLPAFKRLLGLRFAGVYTVLAELYLIADREPDHSIINLSLQMLTTPSITAEVVERGNFLTNLMAILYTFLTTRQVGYPIDVDPLATLAFEQGAVSNRRICQFYMDMKYLLLSELVQEQIRSEEKYLLQFLDLAKLHQGICPNVRAVGEHIEYETDAWITASIVTAEIMRLCRWVADAFAVQTHQDFLDLARAIRNTARVTTIHSLGSERRRFDQSEIRAEARMTTLPPFQFDIRADTDAVSYRVVEFDGMSEPMSFYHPLHYTLSWLIDRGKSMSSGEMRQLLLFTYPELTALTIPVKSVVPELSAEDNLLAMFDFPIRICAWLAQMRAGLWVRNGMTLRHQMTTYKNVPRKDLGYQRDIFLIQVALAVCPPATILATIITRFGVADLVRGNFDFSGDDEIDEPKKLDLAEDFVHLLIILLSERTHLRPLAEDPNPSLTVARRDIIHALCTKPLSHSELSSKLSEKISDSIEFGDMLEEMTTYRPPEGLNDSGTFALKDEYFTDIEPYLAHFSRNQREEADLVYRNHIASKTGKDPSEIVYEPKLTPIQTGLFRDLAVITRTPLFSQVIFYFLYFAANSSHHAPSLPVTKVEQFLQFVLHLVLVAVLEDDTKEADVNTADELSFCSIVLRKRASGPNLEKTTIAQMLRQLADMETFKACEPKIRAILRHLRHKRPSTYTVWMHSIDLPVERSNTASPASSAALEKELKKKQALERQEKVMAQFKQQQASFMANQMDWGDDDFSDLDEDVDTPEEEEEENLWKYPTGTCILCQEETTNDKLYGTFSLINDSNILRQTDVDDADWMQEIVDTPVNLDHSADALRPFGVSGKNRRAIRKVTTDGRVQNIERQELGKGFPTRLTKRGPVATGCGHIMHCSCFEIFIAATNRRHGQQIARNHPERLERFEFLCPLCKALGNAFLPIIWKGKQISYPGILKTGHSFDDFLNSQIGVQVSRLEKERGGHDTAKESIVANRVERLFLNYSSEEIIAPLSAQIPQLTSSNATYSTPPATAQRHSLISQLPSFLQFGIDDPSTTVPSIGSSDNTTVPPQLMEVIKVYQRLRTSLRVNGINSMFSYPTTSNSQGDLTFTDSLARTLAYSISATEIAQRGVESSPEATLLEKISPQSLTHLRVLSETVSTYVTIGGLRAGGANATYREFSEMQRRQLQQLFIGHPQVHGLLSNGVLSLPQELRLLKPLLAYDQFIFLAEASVYLVPALHFDILHIMRLCYFAEVIRAMLEYQQREFSDNYITRETSYPQSFILFSRLLRYLDHEGHDLDFRPFEALPERSQPGVQAFYKIVESYALPFVRKCVILIHVRYGVEFPRVSASADESELTRLSRILGLPTIDEMFSHALNSPAILAMISAWIQHRHLAEEYQSRSQTAITLSHPAIFELVGLPKTFDTLQDEIMRRRCPTTGKDLTDPCVCLFCGEIFCGQAVCCTNEEQNGGCYQHRTR